LRTVNGLSQEALAERAGLHRTYIGGIERGERNVSLVNIGLLADALDVSLAALMSAVERDLRAT
jgi:transcriptional regulator with XRE-family HTH domain